jgi:hypothetical protein
LVADNKMAGRVDGHNCRAAKKVPNVGSLVTNLHNVCVIAAKAKRTCRIAADVGRANPAGKTFTVKVPGSARALAQRCSSGAL